MFVPILLRHLLLLNQTLLEQDFHLSYLSKFPRPPQWGLADKSETRLTGFTGNRHRNAALMMAMFPEVDIFTPSMVDLYEGDPGDVGSLYERALVHRELNLLSRGRFLPMVCFHPERHYSEKIRERTRKTPTKDYYWPMDLVEKAITEWGFIGVKVHPSSGFSPWNNEEHGCPNTYRQEVPEDWDEMKVVYEESMEELFALCKRLNVPVLTHSGTSITSNGGCMHEGKSRDWTNSPIHWLKAAEKANKFDRETKQPPLRVCLAHFAGGFVWNKEKDEWEKHPFLDLANEAMVKNENICIDLSILTQLFDNKHKDKYEDKFLKYLEDNPHMAERLLYGTDWHMPSAARVGSEYFSGMQRVLNAIDLPERNQIVANTMGRNAVDFFGLRKGQANRKRLEAFYDEYDVDTDEIPWMKSDLV